MEILSTGEKIKRARVYKGITLKDLCGDKISISKMSCIENGKIKADDDILLYISDKLELDFTYLKEDIRDQIVQNIEKIQKNLVENENLEEFIKVNLGYAKGNNYIDLAFKLIHILFRIIMKSDKKDQLQDIIGQYFDIHEIHNSVEDILVYYNDMAEFYFLNQEYNEAINYYNKILKTLNEHMPKNKEVYIHNLFNKTCCYICLNDIQKAFSIIEKAQRHIRKIKDNLLKGKIYHTYGNLNILLHNENSEEYLKCAFKYLKNYEDTLGKAYAETAKVYFEVGENVIAKEYMLTGVNNFKDVKNSEYVKFLLYCIEVLFDYNEYKFAMDMIDDALNLAICNDDIKLIERAYYFKGMTLQKSGDYKGAEIYMNLSTDSLLKFATKGQRYKRYNEMGQLYYNLNELKDSIKYFTLALNIEKEL